MTVPRKVHVFSHKAADTAVLLLADIPDRILPPADIPAGIVVPAPSFDRNHFHPSYFLP